MTSRSRTPRTFTVQMPDGPVEAVDGGYFDESDGLRTVTGALIDQALVDEVVADIHEQMATDPARFTGGGRPSLSGKPGTRSPQVAFRVPDGLAAQLDELTQRLGVSRSVVAREALAEYVAAHRP